MTANPADIVDLDAVEHDMVGRGDMLGPELGAKVLALIEAQKAEIDTLRMERNHALDVVQAAEEAINWALGAGDDFRLREAGEGPYWWRAELAQRARLSYDREAGVYRAALQGERG